MTQLARLENLLREFGIRVNVDTKHTANGETHLWFDACCGDNVTFIFDKHGAFVKQKYSEV